MPADISSIVRNIAADVVRPLTFSGRRTSSSSTSNVRDFPQRFVALVMPRKVDISHSTCIQE